MCEVGLQKFHVHTNPWEKKESRIRFGMLLVGISPLAFAGISAVAGANLVFHTYSSARADSLREGMEGIDVLFLRHSQWYCDSDGSWSLVIDRSARYMVTDGYGT